MSSPMSKNSDTMTNDKVSTSISQQLGFPTESLFNIARHFLKGSRNSSAF